MKKALGIITLGLMGLFIIASCKKDPKPVEPKTTIVFGDTIKYLFIIKGQNESG